MGNFPYMRGYPCQYTQACYQASARDEVCALPTGFPSLVLSCLGSLSTQLTLVLAYTLPNAHVGHFVRVSIPHNGPNVLLDPSFCHVAPVWETQHGAYHGPFPAILSHFAYPKPHFGLIVRHNRDLAVSWATWLRLLVRGSNPRTLFPGTIPHFPPLRMAPTYP